MIKEIIAKNKNRQRNYSGHTLYGCQNCPQTIIKKAHRKKNQTILSTRQQSTMDDRVTRKLKVFILLVITLPQLTDLINLL